MNTTCRQCLGLMVAFLASLSWGGGVECAAANWELTTAGEYEVTADTSYSGVYYRQAAASDVITVTVKNKATLTVTNSLLMGDKSTSRVCNLIIDDGNLRLSGSTSSGGDYIYGKYNLVGHYPNSTSTIQLKSGTLVVDNHLNLGWHSKGTLTIDGGTATIENIGFNSSDRKNASGSPYYGINANCWGTLNLNGGVLKLGTIESRQQTYYPNNYTINLSGGTLQPKNTMLTVGLNGTLTSGKTTTFHADAGQTLEWSGNLSGAGGLTKTGAGTLVLSGANNYAGKTTVEAGTLQLDGSVTGAVELLDDAILTGEGTFGSLAFAGNGQILTSVGLDASSVEGLTILGDAVLQEGMFDFLFEDIHAVKDQPMQIFSAKSYSGWDGALDALLADAWQGVIHLNLENGGIYATVDAAAIPEPATWLLGLLGLAFLLGRRGKSVKIR
ncbi:MAG: autotransporter-associated beta strand repeat-containing protein [Planctomycetia bacterium]|nr:autotransporter-associated beta strand repeat-containing protein [Planctomycetia bacterium]